MGICKRGLEANGLTAGVNTRVILMLRGESRLARWKWSSAAPGCEGDPTPVAGDGFLQIAGNLENTAEIDVSFHNARVNANGSAETINGLGRLAALFVDVSQVDVGFGMFGVKYDRLRREGGEGFVVTGQVAEKLAKVAVIIGFIGSDLHGLADVSYGFIEAAPLPEHDAQEMKHIGIVGDLGEDLAITLFRLNHASGDVVLDGDGQNLFRCHCATVMHAS